MASTTPLQSFPVPTATDSLNVVRDITNLANAVEKRVAAVYATASDRDTKNSAPQEGQLAYLKDVDYYTLYTGAAWVNLVPTLPSFTSGSTVPANTVGNNGDVFYKI